jgi:protein O-mannosyl-transferase
MMFTKLSPVTVLSMRGERCIIAITKRTSLWRDVAMAKKLRKITAEEFARRLKVITKEADKRFTVFLGAGCSVSSGIPTAGVLVKERWLPRLRDVCDPECKDLETLANKELPGYDPKNPSSSYGKVMERLFLSPEERQREIEDLCDGTFPGFGYAVLSSLVALKDGCLNVVLSTNFDDLMADALYLFSSARPLVITHESLAGFIRPTRTRPLIVKLHGDNRLSPQNTAEETKSLKKDIEKQVVSVLHDRGLIFIGYGGNDKSIKEMLEAVPIEGLPLGVFWISGKEPKGIIRPWLESRNTIWVEKGDFDQLMLLVRDIFDLPHPDRKRFDEVFSKYTETYSSLSARIMSLPSSAPDSSVMKEAVKRADESFPDWWSVVVMAQRLKETNPEGADTIYVKGLQQFPGYAPLIGSYAIFLKNIRKDYNRAEEYYKKAIESDPKNAINLGNYANFLSDIRKDYNRAEEYYKKAIESDPKYAIHLGNYASFLSDIRKDYDRAEEYYKKAIESDPKYAIHLGNYALFLSDIRKDYNRAEEYYKKAIELAPKNANILGNYAGFLLFLGKSKEGLLVLNKVLPLLNTPGIQDGLAAECWFYAFAHRPSAHRDEALKNLKRVLQSGDRSPGWDLSQNIAQARKDGHPDVAWLEKLAAVISEGADIKTLDAWPKWEKA